MQTLTESMSQMLGKAQYYFPLFEEILDEYDCHLNLNI